MDVENHMDGEIPMYVENPMNAIVMPVAEVVGTEVMGEVLVEPKRETNNSCFDKFNYYVSTSVSLLFMLSLLGGLITFMIWFLSPNSLGAPDG
jgi:hypothetical protein